MNDEFEDYELTDAELEAADIYGALHHWGHPGFHPGFGGFFGDGFFGGPFGGVPLGFGGVGVPVVGLGAGGSCGGVQTTFVQASPPVLLVPETTVQTVQTSQVSGQSFAVASGCGC